VRAGWALSTRRAQRLGRRVAIKMLRPRHYTGTRRRVTIGYFEKDARGNRIKHPTSSRLPTHRAGRRRQLLREELLEDAHQSAARPSDNAADGRSMGIMMQARSVLDAVTTTRLGSSHPR